MTVLLSVRVPKWIKDLIKEEADRRQENRHQLMGKANISEVVREALAAYLAPLEQQKSR